MWNQNLALRFFPSHEAEWLVLSATYTTRRFALPGRSVPGARCSGWETGGCAKRRVQPVHVPVQLLLPMQHGRRQMCLLGAELLPFILFRCCCYLSEWKGKIWSGREGEKRSVVPDMPRCCVSIAHPSCWLLRGACIQPASMWPLHPHVLARDSFI